MFKNKKHYTHANFVFVLLLSSLLSCNNAHYSSSKTDSHTTFLDDSFKNESSFDELIKPYKDTIDSKMYKVIGHAAQTLDKAQPEGLLTNFISDLILEESQIISAEKSLPKPEMALMNFKGLRTIINEGPITVNNIFQLMPFENEVVLVTLSKEQTIEFLNYIASEGGDGIAGAKFKIKDGKATNIKIDGKPLNKSKYVIATSDYLSKGGDHYTIFTQGSITETKVKLRDMIIDHITKLEEKGLKADAKLDNRITL
nr:5'-nucleotidase C-terminal domain-containing protein [uncultured Carboxylicivirga sp.]